MHYAVVASVDNPEPALSITGERADQAEVFHTSAEFSPGARCSTNVAELHDALNIRINDE
jgi:hypothetical protein